MGFTAEVAEEVTAGAAVPDATRVGTPVATRVAPGTEDVDVAEDVVEPDVPVSPGHAGRCTDAALEVVALPAGNAEAICEIKRVVAADEAAA